MPTTPTLKTIGTNGQIALGKKYAGRHVLIEEQGEGVWLIRTARVIPDSEAWLHEEPAATDLQEALIHAARHRASPDRAEEVLAKAAE